MCKMLASSIPCARIGQTRKPVRIHRAACLYAESLWAWCDKLGFRTATVRSRKTRKGIPDFFRLHPCSANLEPCPEFRKEPRRRFGSMAAFDQIATISQFHLNDLVVFYYLSKADFNPSVCVTELQTMKQITRTFFRTQFLLDPLEQRDF
jgi:hypothetical protein